MKSRKIHSGFNPKLHYYALEYLLGNAWGEKQIKNTQLYNLVKKLTNKALPDCEDRYDKRWRLYVPFKRRGVLISVPVFITEYRKQFFIYFPRLRNLCATKGKDPIEKEYKTIFKEALRFVPLIIKTNGKILEKTIPYDIRTGKIKGKYVMRKVMPKGEKIKLLKLYERHIKRNLKSRGVSLNDYLNVAAVCYRAAYKKKARGLSPLEMYKKWADGRHGGMLDIKHHGSKKEFKKWHDSGAWAGSHPFEIVFSWHRHGIHLYPPVFSSKFSLRVTNYGYAWDFIEMVKALIKKKIPFEATKLEDVLNYLAGETDFTVNECAEHTFYYSPSREDKKLYFNHIRWDKISVPAWK